VPPLDLFTVKVMALIIILVAGMAILYAWRMNPGIPGLRSLANGLLLIMWGGLAGLARLEIPGRGIVIACNAFMLGGMILTVQGVRRFRGLRPLPVMALTVLTTVVSILFLFWLVEVESFRMRVAVISGAFTILCADATVSMFRRVPARGRLNYWATGGAFLLTTVTMLIRTTAALAGFYGNSLFTAGPIEAAQTIFAVVGCLACVFGLLLTSHMQLRQESERLAHFDPLTELPNRRFLLKRLADAGRRTERSGEQLGLIYMDLDDFKEVNDAFGHAAGDELLKRIGAAMTGCLASGECLARIGGDEFVVLVEPVANRADVLARAERLRDVVERLPVTLGLSAKVRVSCGAAIFPDDGASVDQLMRAADDAMYRGKRRRSFAPAIPEAWGTYQPEIEESRISG
jgi:diguanylate cyclase (GGDEF)-like protein